MYDASRKITQIQAEALGAIQEAAEAYIIEIFEASVHCTVHRQRVTAIPVRRHPSPHHPTYD